MRLLNSFLKFLPILVCLIFIQASASNSEAENRVDGELLVMLRPSADINDLIKKTEPVFSNLEIEIIGHLSKSWRIWNLGFSGIDGKEDELLLHIHNMEEVIMAQFNHYVERRDTIPNDSSFGDQWNMHNTGQTGGYVDADIDAPAAWDWPRNIITATGDTIVIAIVDGGMDIDHSDLNYYKNRAETANNGADDDLNGYIDDYDGWDAGSNTGTIPQDNHGTHVAGIAAAKGNNNLGVAGVMWGGQVMPVALDQYTESEVVIAYSYVFDMRKLYDNTNGNLGAFIVAENSSFGINNGQPSAYPLWCAMYDSMGSIGILSSGATTNFAADIDVIGDIPTACESQWLITVTNTTHYDMLSGAAGYGSTTIDIGAPGSGVYSTVGNNSYNYNTGTSMATPHLAGAVGLIFSAACEEFVNSYKVDPASNALLIKEMILYGAEPNTSLDGLTVSGGRLNVGTALDLFMNAFCTNCISVTPIYNELDCYGDNDGFINLSIDSGMAPFDFAWSHGSTNGSVANLTAGTYNVTITSADSCLALVTVTIEQPAELDVLVNVNASLGEATAIPTGGTPPYSYAWNDPTNQSNATAVGLAPGAYQVVVTDDNGCSTWENIQLFASVVELSAEEFGLSLFPNPATDMLQVEWKKSTKLQNLQIVNALGETVSEKSIPRKSNCIFDMNGLNAGVYFLSASTPQHTTFLKFIKY